MLLERLYQPMSAALPSVALAPAALERMSVTRAATTRDPGGDYIPACESSLWLRSPRQQAILRIRAEIIRAFRDFMDSEGFTLVDAPIFTPNACEGTTTLFETQYFDDKAYLSQSGQLYMEAAAMALGRVYCFGPAFRAEKSKTRRHLIEFWMMSLLHRGNAYAVKLRNIAGQVTGDHALVVGHPFIDIWQAVKPSVVGIKAWPTVPKGEDGKEQPGDLNWLHCLAFDSKGNLYAGDIIGKRAQKFVRKN